MDMQQARQSPCVALPGRRCLVAHTELWTFGRCMTLVAAPLRAEDALEARGVLLAAWLFAHRGFLGGVRVIKAITCAGRWW